MIGTFMSFSARLLTILYFQNPHMSRIYILENWGGGGSTLYIDFESVLCETFSTAIRNLQ